MSENLSASVDWKLAETCFAQRGILVVGGIVPASAAMFGYARTGHPGFLWWGAGAVAVLTSRLILDVAFGRRDTQRGRALRPAKWRRLFMIGAWAGGAVCGVGGAYAVLTSDAFTQMLVITMLTAFVMGSAARNAAFPQAAIGSLLLAEIPLMAACLAMREASYNVYVGFAALYTLSVLSMIRHLYLQTVRLLVTDEKNGQLVSEAQRANTELAAANEKLAQMAGTDGLTGVPNRRSFDLALAQESAAARRDGSDIAVLMFDVDNFKGYNDRYGHQAGDDCLRRVAHALAASLGRPRDLLARYGGEEFAALLPQTDGPGAIAFAEDVRARVEGLSLEHAGSAAGVVTVSIGVALLLDGLERTDHEVLRNADRALYAAKRGGRNRVEAAPGAAVSGRLVLGSAEHLNSL